MPEGTTSVITDVEIERASILSTPKIEAIKRDAEREAQSEINRINDEMLREVFALGFKTGYEAHAEEE